MFDVIYQYMDQLLGLSLKDITLMHMIFRVLIIYIFGILILNLINKRFIGEKTPLDLILRFVIGNSLANAITGGSPYFPTLGMVLFIILLNSILSYLSLFNNFIDKILKGTPVILYESGEFQTHALRRYHLTKEDILSEIRKDAGIENLNDIKQIYLENSGEISIIPKNIEINHSKVRADGLDD